MKYALIFLLLLSGCALLPQEGEPLDATLSRVLKVSLVGYDVAMDGVKTLHAEGLITDEQRLSIDRIAKLYKDAHTIATKSLLAYQAITSAENEEALYAAIGEMSATMMRLTAYISQFQDA